MDIIKKLEEAISYQSKNSFWLTQAMTHKSYVKRYPEHAQFGNNERLEFLGDAVIDMIVADDLFQMYPEDNEGALSRKRASLVNEESLYNIAMRLKLDDFILVDEREQGTSALKSNKRLIASFFEAIIGAVYKDAGYEEASQWLRQLLREQGRYDFSIHDFEKDFKTRLQENIQEKLKVTPIYRLVDLQGPDHQKKFRVQVLVNEEVYGQGEGESKKAAEQEAASQALKRITNEF